MSICIFCSTEGQMMEFPTVRDLNEHIKSGHKTRPEGWKPRQKRITLADAEKKATTLPPPPPETLPSVTGVGKTAPKPDVKPTPIVLEYKYSGMCPDCRGPVDTIIIPLKEKDSAVAYCPVCHKQHKEQKVVPIDKQ